MKNHPTGENHNQFTIEELIMPISAIDITVSLTVADQSIGSILRVCFIYTKIMNQYELISKSLNGSQTKVRILPSTLFFTFTWRLIS